MRTFTSHLGLPVSWACCVVPKACGGRNLKLDLGMRSRTSQLEGNLRAHRRYAVLPLSVHADNMKTVSVGLVAVLAECTALATALSMSLGLHSGLATEYPVQWQLYASW